VTLSDPPKALRHSAPTGNGPLSEWQEELVQLAAQLTEDPVYLYGMFGQPPMNVNQAAAYVESQVRFEGLVSQVVPILFEGLVLQVVPILFNDELAFRTVSAA
jgi:hypothetical protein